MFQRSHHHSGFFPLKPAHSSTLLYMAISDVVARNLTTIFLALMASFEACGFICGRSFNGGYLLVVSTAAVILILLTTLTWDVSHKATCAFHRDHRDSREVCKGGICWHGVAPRSPASQVRFRLPRQLPLAPL